MIKRIVVITNKYPNKYEKNVLVFLQQLVWQFADMGIACTVISPVPVNIKPQYICLPFHTNEYTENGALIDVYYPKYIGFGQTKVFGINPTKLTTSLFSWSVKKTIKKINIIPDLFYSHFVTPAGICASRLSKKYGITAVMAYGESTPMTIQHYGEKTISKALEYLSGIIAVSSKNKRILLDYGILDENRIVVIPNGYRKERFFPRDKRASRKNFLFPEDKFIVSFVGSFDERKGIKRLEEAVDRLDDVYFICAGKGKLSPSSKKCLFAGEVDNAILPYFYSSSNVFVLPTLNEGCCNAIIEVMACGLPIISSNMSFNDELLNEDNSIRINPNNVCEIINAIKVIKDNSNLRLKMSNASLQKAKQLSLQKRAQSIISFFDQVIKNK